MDWLPTQTHTPEICDRDPSKPQRCMRILSSEEAGARFVFFYAFRPIFSLRLTCLSEPDYFDCNELKKIDVRASRAFTLSVQNITNTDGRFEIALDTPVNNKDLTIVFQPSDRCPGDVFKGFRACPKRSRGFGFHICGREDSVFAATNNRDADHHQGPLHCAFSHHFDGRAYISNKIL